MARAVYQSISSKVEQLEIPIGTALNCIQSMLAERRARADVTPSSRPSASGPVQSLDVSLPSPPPISSGTRAATKTAAPKPKPKLKPKPKPNPNDEVPKTSDSLESQHEDRDPGVSDAVWQQLLKDKIEATIQSGRAAQMLQDQAKAHRLAVKAEERAAQEAARLREIQAKTEAEARELLRLREEAQIREREAKAERERIRREWERKKQEEQKRIKKEKATQSRLQQMGVCVAGFRWIKQDGGYRCAGGTHWVSDSQLGI